MKLQHLSNNELEQSFYHVVRNERKILHLVILHVQEVSRRKLFLAKGYGSLFEYLTKEMKYSGSAAQRRIEAARLLNDVPSVSAKLESGEINLSQIGELQRGVKEAEKFHQEKVTASVKAELVNQLMGQSTSQSQQLIAEALDIPVIENERIRTQKDHSKRAEIGFTEEQWEKYEKLRDLFAHKNFQAKRTQKMNDVLETLFDELLAKQQHYANVNDFRELKPILQKSNLLVEKSDSINIERTNCNTEAVTTCNTEAVTTCNTEAVTTCNAGAVTACGTETVIEEAELSKVFHAKNAKLKGTSRSDGKANWNSLTPKRKKIILEEDSCCQYTNYETGRVCGSTFNLHVDHIIPKYAGGSNEPGNLRVLCRAHSLFRRVTLDQAQLARIV